LFQARSIQELARKKFEKLRVDFDRSQSELKSEQKTRSNSLIKKPAKKPLGHTSQEPIGSDFSSGATLATIGDVLPTSHPMQGVVCERPGNIDGLVEGNAFMIDANQEKAEDYISGITRRDQALSCLHCSILFNFSRILLSSSSYSLLRLLLCCFREGSALQVGKKTIYARYGTSCNL